MLNSADHSALYTLEKHLLSFVLVYRKSKSYMLFVCRNISYGVCECVVRVSLCECFSFVSDNIKSKGFILITLSLESSNSTTMLSAIHYICVCMYMYVCVCLNQDLRPPVITQMQQIQLNIQGG